MPIHISRASYLLNGKISDNASERPPGDAVVPPLCELPECVHAASEILYNLDPNYAEIDPCTDFDQYICGGWRERHDMRPDQGSIFAGTIMAENAQTRLRHILESEQAQLPGRSSPDSENFQKLKAAYTACVDEATVKERGAKPLEDILARLEEIYHTSSVSVHSPKENLTNAVLYLMESGVEALVSSYIAVRGKLSIIRSLKFLLTLKV